MKVHEIMTAHARCVGPDNNLVEAAGLMRELDIGAVPVCDNERLAGMVTDRDITIRAVADGCDPNATLVRDVMSQGIVYVFADQEVEEAVRIMEEKQVRRLPVLNREKRLVGIVALGDIATTSNPAFSGIALREVSESERTLAHRGAKEQGQRMQMAGRRAATGSPQVPGETRRGPERERRRASGTGGRAGGGAGARDGGAGRGATSGRRGTKARDAGSPSPRRAKTPSGRAVAAGGGQTRARTKAQGGARRPGVGGGNRLGGRKRTTQTSGSSAGSRG